MDYLAGNVQLVIAIFGQNILVKFNDFLEYFGFQYECNVIY